MATIRRNLRYDKALLPEVLKRFQQSYGRQTTCRSDGSPAGSARRSGGDRRVSRLQNAASASCVICVYRWAAGAENHHAPAARGFRRAAASACAFRRPPQGVTCPDVRSPAAARLLSVQILLDLVDEFPRDGHALFDQFVDILGSATIHQGRQGMHGDVEEFVTLGHMEFPHLCLDGYSGQCDGNPRIH